MMSDTQRAALNAALNSIQSALALDEVQDLNSVTDAPIADTQATAPAVPAPEITLPEGQAAPVVADDKPVENVAESSSYQDNVADPSGFSYSVPNMPMPVG